MADTFRLLPTTLDLLVWQHTHDMLHAVPCQHGILPKCEVGILRGVPGVLRVFHDEDNLSVPHDEGEVRVCTLVTHEPGTAGEMRVEDGSNAFDLVVVALAGGWEGLGMEDVEPVNANEGG